MSEEILIYYQKHGKISDPQKYNYIIESFPSNIEKIVNHSIFYVINDFLFEQDIFDLPKYFINDMNIRSIKKRLEIAENRSNIEKEYKTVGNCRDISLFICSVLREKGIPARIRSGFATFFDPLKKFDHWICEYWDNTKNKWKKIDGWMQQVKLELSKLPDFFKENFFKLNMDPLDIDSQFFITSAEAWNLCRNNMDKFENYGTIVEEKKGDWFIRDSIIRDLFCLNKMEPLPWDCWGKMGIDNSDINDSDIQLLDKVATYITNENFNMKTLNEFYSMFSPFSFPCSE